MQPFCCSFTQCPTLEIIADVHVPKVMKAALGLMPAFARAWMNVVLIDPIGSPSPSGNTHVLLN